MFPRFAWTNVFRSLRRFVYAFLAAFMIGVSNIILEEDRSVNDTRVRVEQQHIEPQEE